MAPESNLVILAHDAYKDWKRRVQAATESVRVFTPYFDRMLDRLLSNACLDPGALSVVTDFSPTSGALDYRGQLLGARALLRRGVEVRSLSRLHAKVLVCDGAQVAVGSQNFTTYGRGSKETTVIPADVVSGTEFVSTLEEWYQISTPVTLEFIELLLAELDEAARSAVEASGRLSTAFDERWSAYLKVREEERRRRERLSRLQPLASQLASAVQTTTQRTARPMVWARLGIAGEYDYYETLLADKNSTLAAWPMKDLKGRRAITELRRLSFYPIILNPSGRMAFARVAGTRITYVRQAVKWVRPFEILGTYYNLTVRFPKDGLEARNIEMSLSMSGPPASVSLELSLRFDGLAFTMTSWEIVARSPTSTLGTRRIESLTVSLETLVDGLHDAEELDELFHAAFRTFRFSELGVGNRNANDFFPQGWVRVALIEYSERPVLVVTPLHV